MAYQTLPLALNYWQGNQFVPAPVQWAPRPKPVYETALETPSVTGNPSPAQSALGIGSDAGFQGGQPGSEKGVGLNAVSPSFQDFALAAMTGPAMALPSFGVQAVTNALAGNAGKAINGLGVLDAVRNLGETLGIGGGAQRGVDTGSFQGPNYDGTTVDQSPQGPNPDGSVYEGGDTAPGGYGGNADSSPDPNGDHAYFKGGKVKGLLGGDPAGPDQGYAALQKGEYVVKKSSTKHYGSGLLDAINEKKIDKKKLKGLLG